MASCQRVVCKGVSRVVQRCVPSSCILEINQCMRARMNRDKKSSSRRLLVNDPPRPTDFQTTANNPMIDLVIMFILSHSCIRRLIVMGAKRELFVI